MFDSIPGVILGVLGIGFLVANVRVFGNLIRFLRIRSSALLTWRTGHPPYYGLMLGIGLVLGALVFVKIVILQRPPTHAFGEGMMFLYYAYGMPLSLRIARGFYEEGIWAESGFIRYSQIGGLRWQENGEITLVLTSRARRLGRRLVVPGRHYGAARRLLRDKIAAYDISFFDKPLDLGARDERDDV